MSEVLNFRVPDGEKAKIEAAAKRRGMSPSAFIRDRLEVGREVEAELRGEPAPPVASAQEIEEEARRIYGAEGVPMSEARRRAARRLGEGT